MNRPANLVFVALALVVAGAPASNGQTSFDATLARARTSWAQFEVDFESVLADERYRQDARWPRAPKESGSVIRVTESEVYLLRIPGANDWVTFREVLTIDDYPPSAPVAPAIPSPSVTKTLADTSLSLTSRIGLLVEASARYNLGEIERTINTPTFAPIVLRASHAARFRFTSDGDALVDGAPATVVRFDERRSPTIVRGPGRRDIPLRGRLWVKTSTGEVLRSVLEMEDRRSGLKATIDVEYGLDAGLERRVPQVMRERYARRGHIITTEATYANYRRFTTSARIVGQSK